MHILTLLAVLATTTVPDIAAAQAQTGTEDKPIIITGQRLSDLKKTLAACIAAKCPPDQEIAAALAVAENQFVSGNYRDARNTTQSTIGRNKRFAKSYPVPVSDLLRADYRVAEHLGDGDAFRIGAFDTLSALKAGLPENDYRVLGGEIEVGDMYARFGRVDEAIERYAVAERRAIKFGLYNVQGMARLRMVALYAQLANATPRLYKADARKSAAALIDSTEPHLKPFGQAALVLLARLDAKDGDTTAIDRLIADYRLSGTNNVPTLLYSPPIDVAGTNDRDRTSGISDGASGSGAGIMLSDTTMTRLARSNYDGEWVDIGFWVRPDGRVDDAYLLRGGKGSEKVSYWVKPILASIGGRRYAPLKMDPSQPGILRVERYTFTARLTTNTGSRLAVRETTPQIEMLDLSADPSPTPVAKN